MLSEKNKKLESYLREFLSRQGFSDIMFGEVEYDNDILITASCKAPFFIFSDMDLLSRKHSIDENGKEPYSFLAYGEKKCKNGNLVSRAKRMIESRRASVCFNISDVTVGLKIQGKYSIVSELGKSLDMYGISKKGLVELKTIAPLIIDYIEYVLRYCNQNIKKF